MPAGPPAIGFLDQEARALLTRLDRVRPFALHETMVPAAALLPTAQSAIDRALIEGRRALRRQVLGYLGWLRGPGRWASPAEQQRQFTLIRLRFNDVLSQFDLFTEVVTQRSEHTTGVWLSGLDAVAADALALPGSLVDPPRSSATSRAAPELPSGGRGPGSPVTTRTPWRSCGCRGNA